MCLIKISFIWLILSLNFIQEFSVGSVVAMFKKTEMRYLTA